MSETGLTERLRLTAQMIALGERIQWGIDAALMNDAADRIADLEAEVARLNQHIETLRAQLDSTLQDRAHILSERDRTFSLILARAEAAVARGLEQGLREAAESLDKKHRGDLPEHIKSFDGESVHALIPASPPPADGDNEGFERASLSDFRAACFGDRTSSTDVGEK